MLPEQGSVVKSVAGHDSGSFYVVTGDRDGFVFIADGRLRTLGKPKLKNPKHVKPTNARIDLEKIANDRQLRLALKSFNEETGE